MSDGEEEREEEEFKQRIEKHREGGKGRNRRTHPKSITILNHVNLP